MKLCVRLSVAVVLTIAAAASVSAQSLPAGWATGDIGVTGAAGSATASGASLTLNGAGLDVWGTGDQFHFTYRALTGDGSIVAKVSALEAVNAWTKAGVMMRETLATGSKHAFMIVSPGKGLAFQRRAATNGTSTHTSGGAGTAPRWVRLERAGNLFTASTSFDCETWTVVGSQTINMASSISVGVAVGSHVTGVLARATFDGVSVTRTLPSGWYGRDIGAVGAAGETVYADDSFAVTGAGLDVWGSADQFHFAYQKMSGDGEVVARVASIQNIAPWTKAGVMMRESLTDRSAHAFMLASPGKGLAYQRRPATGGLSVNTAGGSVSGPVYLKVARSGNVFTASTSADGANWSVVGTQTITMGATIHVGLAVGSHVTGVLATSVFDHVSVTPAAAASASTTTTTASAISSPTTSTATTTTTTVPEETTSTTATSLRLVQWNVRHGGTRSDGVYDPANTVKWILSKNPDVVSLNEIDNTTQAGKLMAQLRSQSGDSSWDYTYDGRGNMLASKLPIIDKDICVVNSAIGRKSAFVTVLQNGRTVSVYSNHFALTEAERLVDIAGVQACADNKVQNRILSGDYNMQSTSVTYAKMVVGHSDAWKVAKAKGAAVNYSGNCDGCTKNSRIDYVFTSNGATALELKSAEVFDTRNAAGVMASDHKPMVVVYDVK